MPGEGHPMSVTEARALAVRAHADQRDRDGSFHIAHVARVSEAVPRADPYQRVAWLHDVIEDSDVEIDHLRSHLPPHELEALMLLTHEANQSYDAYIERLVDAEGEAGSLARAVKEADLLDNLRRSAAAHDPAVGQYGRALARLWRAGAPNQRR